jgi:hypothetical protein
VIRALVSIAGTVLMVLVVLFVINWFFPGVVPGLLTQFWAFVTSLFAHPISGPVPG